MPIIPTPGMLRQGQPGLLDGSWIKWGHKRKINTWPDIVPGVCDTSLQDAEATESAIQSQSGLHNKALSQKTDLTT